MTQVLFRDEGAQIIPLKEGAVGPWMADAVNGAAIAPLIAALIEDVRVGYPVLTTRISVEFLRPVPMRTLDIRTEIICEGRNQQILHIGITPGSIGCRSAVMIMAPALRKCG
jgi:acyl-coenzyme A thioesterase PaaI-like protein